MFVTRMAVVDDWSWRATSLFNIFESLTTIVQATERRYDSGDDLGDDKNE